MRASTPSPLSSGLLSKTPWVFVCASVVALLIQLNPAWRSALIFDRYALQQHELWRLWSGHWVHFGWAHFAADTALLLILGVWAERHHRRFAYLSLLLMPLFISACIYFFDPAMERYAGLSALNLGLLVYLALQGWQRKWTDWFWPAVLALYIGEVVFEILRGGRGGGMIAFDDPTVKVATSAHIASAGYALGAWFFSRITGYPPRPKRD